MPSLTYVMISMSASDMSNGVNGTGIFDEGASPGRVARGQQPAPGRYPATAAQANGPRKGRTKWLVEENRALMECYFKSIPERVQNRNQGECSCD